MERKLSWYEASFSRTSRRAYTGEKMEIHQKDGILQIIKEINKESNLNFKFVNDAKNIFGSLKTSYGIFSGVTSIIALVGDNKIENIESHIGYYGEFLVLECVSLGLGTCWVGGTYDKEAIANELSLQEGEELFAIISVGKIKDEKNLKEKLMSKFSKKQTFAELLQKKEGEIPSWVQSGIEIAQIAPSAMNKKPVAYSYLNQELKVYTTKPNKGFDIGISLAHFELGALKEGVKVDWICHKSTISEDGIHFSFQQK